MKTLTYDDPYINAEDFMFLTQRNAEVTIQGRPWREVAKKYKECIIKGLNGWEVTIIYLGGNSYLME